ncbi:hypothetical protein CVT25_015654 [Psilocybe cyanescens]|uniref:DUF6533 domain-containing protein n=1 Tax=Psilocybe cyanescens TaxID=93625 RepID=A0A409WHZ6_PSICY|nr:hypothetical protein CVT25_015654 [Psilocybe cyanescens]
MLLVPSFDQLTQTGADFQVMVIRGQPGTTPSIECQIGYSRATATKLAVSWEALIAYDSFIFGLLLWKTFGERRTRFPVIGVNRLPLRDLLIRDGVIYYLVAVLVNLANAITFYFPQPVMRGCLSNVSCNISIIMMSRLMLNLHEWNKLLCLRADITHFWIVYPTMPNFLPADVSGSGVNEQILINNYVHVAAITCLFYDYLVTFDAEVTYIWRRPKSIGVYSFLVNRYFAIVANVIIVIPGIGENAHSEQYSGLAAAWECLIAYDTMIFGFLVYKCFRLDDISNDAQPSSNGERGPGDPSFQA